MPEPGVETTRAPQVQHLLLHAHGPTDDLRRARFGGTAPLSHPELLQPVTEPITRWLCGPEPACQETLTRWEIEPQPIAALAGPRFGTWDGKTLAEVADTDPESLAAWTNDPAHPPPGGESLTSLINRVRTVTAYLSAAGWTGIITTPLATRALVVVTLEAPAELITRIEISPGGRAHLTRPNQQKPWRLRQLS